MVYVFVLLPSGCSISSSLSHLGGAVGAAGAGCGVAVGVYVCAASCVMCVPSCFLVTTKASSKRILDRRVFLLGVAFLVLVRGSVSLLCDRHTARLASTPPTTALVLGVPVVGRTVFRLPIYRSVRAVCCERGLFLL